MNAKSAGTLIGAYFGSASAARSSCSRRRVGGGARSSTCATSRASRLRRPPPLGHRDQRRCSGSCPSRNLDYVAREVAADAHRLARALGGAGAPAAARRSRPRYKRAVVLGANKRLGRRARTSCCKSQRDAMLLPGLERPRRGQARSALDARSPPRNATTPSPSSPPRRRGPGPRRRRRAARGGGVARRDGGEASRARTRSARGEPERDGRDALRTAGAARRRRRAARVLRAAQRRLTASGGGGGERGEQRRPPLLQGGDTTRQVAETRIAEAPPATARGHPHAQRRLRRRRRRRAAAEECEVEQQRRGGGGAEVSDQEAGALLHAEPSDAACVCVPPPMHARDARGLRPRRHRDLRRDPAGGVSGGRRRPARRRSET